MLGLGDQIARERLRIGDGPGHVVDRAARDARRAQALQPRRRAFAEQHRRELVDAGLAVLVARGHGREARVADHPVQARARRTAASKNLSLGQATTIQPSRVGKFWNGTIEGCAEFAKRSGS